jgi:23S rRNA pseudouridine1911/1915/1917 synthase
MSERIAVTVPEDLAGVRADRVLALLGKMSRRVARDLIEDGGVSVSGVAIERATQLAAGDVIDYALPDQEVELVAEPVSFSVAWDKRDVIVVDKPPGVVVHPGAGNETGTLVGGLVHRFPELSALGGKHRWGLVHRLDRDTSGLLLVARSIDMHEFLQQELKARRITRSYLALVSGQLESATGTIDAPIGRDPLQPTRMALVPHGRPARTHYRRLAVWEHVTLVDVRLETGRTHQIRVHFSSIGHSIVGDQMYGRGGALPGDPGRIWLHAVRLRFPSESGDYTEVAAPVPKDLRESLADLGEPLSGLVEL